MEAAPLEVEDTGHDACPFLKQSLCLTCSQSHIRARKILQTEKWTRISLVLLINSLRYQPSLELFLEPEANRWPLCAASAGLRNKIVPPENLLPVNVTGEHTQD